jgi:bifunctional DNA-binding transcriptional regulator/antitoxin component of YhaV-PrlF toxin-antitoxin module
MAGAQRYLVSTSGQMSLPAAARKRWGLERGGPVEVQDLGFAVIVRPEAVAEVGRWLDTWMSEDDYHHGVTTDDDPDLRTT